MALYRAVNDRADEGRGEERRTRGGSWWYGEAQMRAGAIADEPADFGAVHIGFRCAKGLTPH